MRKNINQDDTEQILTYGVVVAVATVLAIVIWRVTL